MAATRVDCEVADTRREANSIGLAMLASGAGIALAEIVVQTIVYSRLPGVLRVRAIDWGPWSFAVLQLLVWRLAAPLGRRAPIVVLAATAVQLVMVTQTRGAWVWWGTFDKYPLSRGGWYGPLLGGAVLGALLTFSLWRGLKGRHATDRAAGVGFFLSFSVAGLSMLLSRGEPIESEFAPTRHLALVGLIVALGIGFAFTRREG